MSPRRRFRAPRRIAPLDPETFARRIATKVGTEYGTELHRRVLDIVMRTGDADPWIRAVQRLRESGAISAAVARFLIFQFVEMTPSVLMETDPELADISAQIDAIRRAHGLADDEDWYVDEGPPEWQALQQQWNERTDVLMSEIFQRHGEHELASMNDPSGDPLFEAGRAEMFAWEHGEEPDDRH